MGPKDPDERESGFLLPSRSTQYSRAHSYIRWIANATKARKMVLEFRHRRSALVQLLEDEKDRERF